jgi:hypothetical protein
MSKILSQAGDSLADSYDVAGSIAGVEDLISQDVQLLHEMGGTIFSERLRSQVITLATGAIGQNSEFDASFAWDSLVDSPVRVLGIQVVASAVTRVQLAQVSIQGVGSMSEIPFFSYDYDDDAAGLIILSIQGAAVSTYIHLSPRQIQVPTLVTRAGDSGVMPGFILRGLTTGFGSGTVQCTALIHVARAGQATPVAGDPKSHGLPLPSW